MVKVSDFLNTEQVVAIQKTAYADTATINNAGQTLQNESQLVNQAINDAANEKARMKSLSMQNAQVQAQAKLQLNNIYGGLEEINLKTVGTLAAIDEQNRRQKEEALAQSYLLSETTKFQVEAQQAYKQIKASAQKDGEDLLPKVQDWVNTKLADMEQRAPNAVAISSLKSFGAKALVQYGGQAVEDADNMRTNYALDLNNEALNSARQLLISNPLDSDATSIVRGLTDNLKEFGIDPEVIRKQENAYAASIVDAQVEGFVNQGEFNTVAQMLKSDFVNKTLTPGQIDGLKKSAYSAEVEFNKAIANQTKTATIEAAFFGQNSITKNTDSKTKQIAGELFADKLNQLHARFTPEQANGYLTAVTQLFKDTNRFVPDEAINNIEDVLSNNSNGALVATLAQAVTLMGKDGDTNAAFSQISKQSKAEAFLISKFINTMSPEEAIKAARFRTREFDKELVAQNLKEANKELSMEDNKSIFTKLFIFDTDRGQDQVAAEFRSSVLEYVNSGLQYQEASKLVLNEMQNSYIKSEFNENTILSNGDSYGTDSVRHGIEHYLPSETEQNVLRTVMMDKVNRVAGNQNWKVDLEKNQFISSNGNVTETRPFILQPIEYKTDYLYNQSGVLAFELVNPERPYESFGEVYLDTKDITKSAAIKAANEEEGLFNHIKSLAKKYFN